MDYLPCMFYMRLQSFLTGGDIMLGVLNVHTVFYYYPVSQKFFMLSHKENKQLQIKKV